MSKRLGEPPESGEGCKRVLVLTLRGEGFGPVPSDFGVDALGDISTLPGPRPSRRDGPA